MVLMILYFFKNKFVDQQLLFSRLFRLNPFKRHLLFEFLVLNIVRDIIFQVLARKY